MQARTAAIILIGFSLATAPLTVAASERGNVSEAPNGTLSLDADNSTERILEINLTALEAAGDTGESLAEKDAPPGLGMEDPWVDANGDTMFGDLAMGSNGVSFQGLELAATSTGQLQFDGQNVCFEGGTCGSTLSGETPIVVDGSTIKLSSTGCGDGELWKWTGSVWDCQADQDTQYDGSDFALSDQSCAAGDVVAGVDTSGNVVCVEDQDTSTSTIEWSNVSEKPAGFADDVDNNTKYDGSDFALSDQSCGSGTLVAGVDASGILICTSDQDTLAELSCTADEITRFDGTNWVCSVDQDTTYTGGTGITVDGTTIVNDLGTSINASEVEDGSLTSTDVDSSSIQSRVTGTCAAGSGIGAISETGSVTCNDHGWIGSSGLVALDNQGDDVAIGPSVAGSKLHVEDGGGFTFDDSNLMKLQSTTDEAVALTFNQSFQTWSIGQNQPPDGNIDEFFVYNHDQDASYLTIETSGQTGIGTVNPATRLDVAGTGAFDSDVRIRAGGLCVDSDGSCTPPTDGEVTAVGYNTGHSDVAELYPSTDELEAGDVVTLDDQVPGNVERTTQQGQTGPLLVVSTAPGMLLGASDAGAYPIALSGRVPVQVTDESGPIQPGDPLTSSSTPGTAMKASDGDPTIGVALEPLAAGSGTIEVFVEPGAQQTAHGGADEDRVEELEQRIKVLEAENERLEERLDELGNLEQRIEALEAANQG